MTIGSPSSVEPDGLLVVRLYRESATPLHQPENDEGGDGEGRPFHGLSSPFVSSAFSSSMASKFFLSFVDSC